MGKLLPLADVLCTQASLASSVTVQMERILGHDLFIRSPRLSQLFRFVVGMSLEGKTHCLKEYTIAVDVFGRPDSFDCRMDSIVRVEAARLRKKLSLFYRTFGASDRLVLTLPATGYEPVILLRESPGDSAANVTTVALVEGNGIRPTSWTRSFEHGAVRLVRISRETAERVGGSYDLMVVFVGPSESYSDYNWVTEVTSRRTEAVLFVLDSDSEASRLAVANAVRAITRDKSSSLTLQSSRPRNQGQPLPFEPMAMDSVA